MDSKTAGKGKTFSKRYDQEAEEEEMDEDLGLENFEVHQKPATAEDNEFDKIVGALQEVLFSEEFQDIQDNFISKHCQKFVETEENTHEMWTIHKNYKKEVEKFLDKEVKKLCPSYSLERFQQLLAGREEQLDEGIVDTISLLDDFLEFKRLALERRLRMIRENNPAEYKKIVDSQPQHELLQEVAKNIEMEDGLFAVQSHPEMY